jgi:hypothetical protein
MQISLGASYHLHLCSFTKVDDCPLVLQVTVASIPWVWALTQLL